MKTQTSIRLSEATRAKLDKLTAKHGTATEVIALAIDRLYTAEEDTMKLLGQKRIENNKAIYTCRLCGRIYVDDYLGDPSHGVAPNIWTWHTPEGAPETCECRDEAAQFYAQ